jgi:phenylacetate-CoA ligase
VIKISSALTIKKAFGVKPLQHYGLTEGVANISEDVDGNLTIDEDFSCIEFLPSYEIGAYSIIGSSLTNWIMPLLRYDTGDLAVVSDLARHNNRGRIIDSLIGRSNEYVLLPNNIKVGAAALSLIFNSFDEIKISQIRQKTIDSIDIDLVLNIPHDLFDEKKLLKAIKERLGLDIIININYVYNIERTKSGKHRLVISNL